MNSIYKKKRLFIFFLFFIFFNITYISNSYSQSSIAVLDVLVMLKDSSAAKSMKEQLDKTLGDIRKVFQIEKKFKLPLKGFLDRDRTYVIAKKMRPH